MATPLPQLLSSSSPSFFNIYTAVLTVILAATQQWINHRQPTPYMDELFHIPQARNLCLAAATFRSPRTPYDAAITTPPGLYAPNALAALAVRVVFLGVEAVRRLAGGSIGFRSGDGGGGHDVSFAEVAVNVACGTRAVRASVAVAAIVALPLAADVLALLCARTVTSIPARRHPDGANDANHNRALSLSPSPAPTVTHYATALLFLLSPFSFFYTTLYYTDTLSTTLLLLAWRLALSNKHPPSAAVALLAALTRQTNAIWHFFFVADILLTSAHAHYLTKRNPLRSLTHSLKPLLPHLVPAVAYVAFLLLNNGVAIGHRTHHAVKLHTAMLPYFFLTHLLTHTPYTLINNTLPRILTLTRMFIPITLAMILTTVALIAYTGAYVHPFSLADNRHFVFYIYRKWILRSSVHRALLSIPAAITPLTTLQELLQSPPSSHTPTSTNTTATDHQRRHQLHINLLTEALFLFCLSLTLLPTPLLEFRYFITPSLILSLRRAARTPQPTSLSKLHAIAFLFLLLNLILLYIFAELPFSRPPDPHMPHDTSPGRFML